MHIPYGTSPRPASKIHRSPFDFAVIFAGLLLLMLMATAIAWQFWHSGRIFTGVEVAGVPVGGLTRAEARIKLEEVGPRLVPPPLVLTLGAERIPLKADAVVAQWSRTDAVNQAYLLGRKGAFPTRLVQQLTLALRGFDLVPRATYDPAQLRQILLETDRQIRQSAEVESGALARDLSERPAPAMDVEGTLSTVAQALSRANGSGVVEAPMVIEAPSTGPSVERPAVSNIPPVDSREVLLLSDDQFGIEAALDPGQMAEIIDSAEPLRVDREALRRHLEQLAGQFDITPRDARLRFNPATGAVTVLRSSQSGRALDIDASLANIETALANGEKRARLSVVAVAPKVDMNRIAEMGIRELVASGTTNFAGSSAARVRNIEVAAQKFDGVVIPPGDSFSFNRFVEDVSGANGFEDSLIIWGDRTAVGVGGGVCQVSTTIFRAAYAGGMPIEERYNHGYVVDWYGEPGMDATIYTPTVDFRFRNDTGSYLLIEPVVDAAGGSITFNLYGTRPNREVVISEPIITQREQPEEPAYQIDEGLAVGERKQVEWPKEGMTVKVERTIVQEGTTRTDTLSSYYQPWRAVYLVGPGTATP